MKWRWFNLSIIKGLGGAGGIKKLPLNSFQLFRGHRKGFVDGDGDGIDASDGIIPCTGDLQPNSIAFHFSCNISNVSNGWWLSADQSTELFPLVIGSFSLLKLDVCSFIYRSALLLLVVVVFELEDHKSLKFQWLVDRTDAFIIRFDRHVN